MPPQQSKPENRQKSPQAEPAAKKPAQHQDDDVAGKAYDSRLMGRLLKYLGPYKWTAIIATVAVILKAGADVLGPYLTKVAVDKYMTHAPAAKQSFLAKYLSSNAWHGITQLALIYIGALVFSYVLEALQTYIVQWTGQKVMFDLRREIFRHLQRMDVGFYDRNPVGRLVTRLTNDVDALNEMFTTGVFAIFEDIFVLAGIVGVMLSMSWWLALVAFAVLPFILLVTRIFRKYVRDSYRRIRTALARINSYSQEHVSGMSIVQLFNREKPAYQSFESINKSYLDAFKDAIMAYALYYPAVEILSSIAIALIIWQGGNGVIRGAVDLGVLVAFMQYAQRFFRPIQDLSEKYNILQAAMAASERIFKLLDTEPEIVSPAQPAAAQPSGPEANSEAGRIEFRNVWFTYQRLTPQQQQQIATATPAELEAMSEIEWILRGVSFTIEPGQTAAIVGHTGAGKTTLTGLMMRFYDIQHGSVLVNGIDVRQHDLTRLRQNFGVVLQDPFLFSGTIADNIRLGSGHITDDELRLAAEQVNVDEFIQTLPAQYQEMLRERGNSLSTGQKQLINFARALAHNPRILILDEATSSVDTDTELRVRTALERMVRDRTSVIVAHRLSTVQRADVILVMHRGHLREMGSHQELLALHGLYWKLYQLQYKDQEMPTLGMSPSLANS
ncbi:MULTISPECIES: ABC transporter ATP-binding protein [Acidobacterium]|uniref:Multidrug resistance-like ATP-binding protein MdlA n=1 Tax=Acidobacterium capsulatum (strain ATCC 51196 / DSM 11244 / BCRC 80197 / JCM 7670 / NBRC 15755 / NCIMB 13165 / 161) TaxID=240015 RepID=C1F720_ACIC5|nr:MULTISPECIES: ABC transporter ATP-binding protein [Acidobacterium]ACO31598.1 efflux ABC transporter, permease/ATP-binding protein [Acidobacterium capsulatum ATCC 51196]HCT59398.1 ABC transporter ATP-binding protein [Acidobacterium sp.]